MTTSISDWLEDHGLSKYTEVFLEHEVDLDTLKLPGAQGLLARDSIGSTLPT